MERSFSGTRPAAKETLSTKERCPSFTSLREQAEDFLRHCGREALYDERSRPELGMEYGDGVVKTKYEAAYHSIDVCVKAYIDRHPEVDARSFRARLHEMLEAKIYKQKRKALEKAQKAHKQEAIRHQLGLSGPGDAERLEENRRSIDEMKESAESYPVGKPPSTPGERLLLEEATQEYALTRLGSDQREYAESINARILVTLDLLDLSDKQPRTAAEAKKFIKKEIDEWVRKELITKKEADAIERSSQKTLETYMKAFAEHTRDSTLGRAFTIARDQARKVTFQAVMDRRTLTGSDHGVRHILGGNMRFAERLTQSLHRYKDIDVNKRDEALIRQIITDHDIGYTFPAVRTRGGRGAAKDHPCAGCLYVEANAGYYTHHFGAHGYAVARDAVLHHDTMRSIYDKKRPAAKNQNSVTYNGDLIASVTSLVDVMGVTAETKTMGLFRHPETVELLQTMRLYADLHKGVIDEVALREFQEDFFLLIEELREKGKITERTAKDYRHAVQTRLDVHAIETTLGQYAGVVRDIRAVRPKKGPIRPEIHMQVSSLQAAISDVFGDPVSLRAFKKAMDALGLGKKEWDMVCAVVSNLEKTEEQIRAPRRSRKKIIRIKKQGAVFSITAEKGPPTGPQKKERGRALKVTETVHRESIREPLRELFARIRSLSVPRQGPLIDHLPNTLLQLYERIESEIRADIIHIATLVRHHVNDDAILEVLESELASIASGGELDRLYYKLDGTPRTYFFDTT